jgi:hypothetical protein
MSDERDEKPGSDEPIIGIDPDFAADPDNHAGGKNDEEAALEAERAEQVEQAGSDASRGGRLSAEVEDEIAAGGLTEGL